MNHLHPPRKVQTEYRRTRRNLYRAQDPESHLRVFFRCMDSTRTTPQRHGYPSERQIALTAVRTRTGCPVSRIGTGLPAFLFLYLGRNRDCQSYFHYSCSYHYFPLIVPLQSGYRRYRGSLPDQPPDHPLGRRPRRQDRKPGRKQRRLHREYRNFPKRRSCSYRN